MTSAKAKKAKPTKPEKGKPILGGRGKGAIVLRVDDGEPHIEHGSIITAVGEARRRFIEIAGIYVIYAPVKVVDSRARAHRPRRPKA